jgi:hypothetical protein
MQSANGSASEFPLIRREITCGNEARDRRVDHPIWNTSFAVKLARNIRLMALPLPQVGVENTSLPRRKDTFGTPRTRVLELAFLYSFRLAGQSSRAWLAVNESAISVQRRFGESNLLVQV